MIRAATVLRALEKGPRCTQHLAQSQGVSTVFMRRFLYALMIYNKVKQVPNHRRPTLSLWSIT